MRKTIGIILTILVSSFVLFPFNLPITGVGINTKMVLAVLGAILFVLDILKGKGLVVSKSFLDLTIICVVVSLWAYCATILNATSDYSFARYFISVWVWLSAAYVIVWLIFRVHGELSVELIGNYLITVSVAQCILAYAMTLSPTLKIFINSLMGDSEMFMGVAEGRVYGLGAALDTAGLRFSGVLVVIAHLIHKTDFGHESFKGIIYLVSFVIVAIIGNMIARSTTIGLAVVVLYWIFCALFGDKMSNQPAFWKTVLPLLLIGTVLVVWLYNIAPQFRTNLRFGFEGFFSLFEKGKWEVRSNDILLNMIIWPESLKTWLIGDGFFDNPMDIPDRFGQVYNGFYKHTDIGYLRYIFYFGVIGLVLMILVPIQMTVCCGRKMPDHKWLFIMLLVTTLIGWLKVSSDIIMVFAPFLILAFEKEVPCTSSTT